MKTLRHTLLIALCLITSQIAGATGTSGKHIYVYQPPLQVWNPQAPKLILIIDDIGNNFSSGKRALSLPGAITYAFLPFTPAAKVLAQHAHRNGKEIMLHAPMSSLHQRKLGPGALTATMDKLEFQTTLRQAIGAIPYLSGVNNHMGSELTQQPEAMEWLMEELSCHNLYFVDSRTNAESVAAQQAIQAGINNLERDVFLDHDDSPEAIADAFDTALQIAKNEGFAVLIGHPYPSTLAFLEKRLPQLASEGIQLSTVSEALSDDQRLLLSNSTTAYR